MARSTSRRPAAVTLGFDGASDGELIAAVTDDDGRVHFASAGSKFVVDGIEKGTLKPAKAEASAEDHGPAAS